MKINQRRLHIIYTNKNSFEINSIIRQNCRNRHKTKQSGKAILNWCNENNLKIWQFLEERTQNVGA